MPNVADAPSASADLSPAPLRFGSDSRRKQPVQSRCLAPYCAGFLARETSVRELASNKGRCAQPFSCIMQTYMGSALQCRSRALSLDPPVRSRHSEQSWDAAATRVLSHSCGDTIPFNRPTPVCPRRPCSSCIVSRVWRLLCLRIADTSIVRFNTVHQSKTHRGYPGA